MSSSPPPSNTFADELDELMRPSSPVSDNLLDPADTTEVANGDLQVEPVESSIGPMRNELSFARHLTRYNKLNLYQRDFLDQVAKVCHICLFYLCFSLRYFRHHL